jgi:hypothetical protein
MRVLLEYAKFNNASNWTLENDYESVYFTNFYTGLNMKLVSRKPIKITHKNNALTLNLTPCDFKDEFYVVPYFGVNLIRQDKRDLDEDFDYSAFAYFNYLTSGTNMRDGIYPEKLLKEILEERFFYISESDTSNDFKLFIREINMKYETNIKENIVLNTVDEFVVELKNSLINISDFIVKEYVLTEKTTHRINNEEKLRLKNIFWIYNDLIFEQIDFQLKNQLYDGYIEGETIGVEMNTDIIRKWNATTHKPMLDADGKDIIADILVYSDGFMFSNYDTDKIKIDSLCSSISEITGTGILLEFDKAKLVFPQKEISYNYRNLPLNVKDYPLFKKSDEEEKTNDYDMTKFHEPSLTNFTGLMIPFSNIQIPINDVMLAVKGNNIIINNLFISGSFEIKGHSTNNLSNQLELSTDKSPIKISTDDLIAYFKNIGIGQVEIKINENSIAVFFKKELN